MLLKEKEMLRKENRMEIRRACCCKKRNYLSEKKGIAKEVNAIERKER